MDLAKFKSDLKESELITNPKKMSLTCIISTTLFYPTWLILTHLSLLGLAPRVPETLGSHLRLWTQNEGRDSLSVFGVGLGRTLTDL